MSQPNTPSGRPAIAFDAGRLIAFGDLIDVARASQAAVDEGATAVLVFDAQTSQPIELDFRAAGPDLDRQVRSLSPASPAATPVPPGRGPGRPRLGVVSREVTLLPRHWDWLAAEPGGASAAIRRLVDDARRDDGRGARRRARESTYRFILALAGDLPGFEEATRALFAGDRSRFSEQTAAWPADIRTHAIRLALPSFD